MSDFVIPVPPLTKLPVVGSKAFFPVGRIYCIGRNYPWRLNEAAATVMPAWFMKPASAVWQAQGNITYPPDTADFCHEIELVVAIGRGGSSIDHRDVESKHIWGYGVGLDLTRRDLQQQAKKMGNPWECAKAFDHSAPCSPLVPASSCGHPKQGRVWLKVNGEERQRADLSDLLWPVPALVAMLSRSVTLQAGDLIFTGTPAGVGPMNRNDIIDAGIDGIGQLSLTVN